jgi:hypothetical protein
MPLRDAVRLTGGQVAYFWCGGTQMAARPSVRLFVSVRAYHAT